MNEPTLDMLTNRLGRLERENRWWRILGSAAVGVLALGLLMGATAGKVSKEIRAERFVLVDENDKMLAELSTLSRMQGLRGPEPLVADLSRLILYDRDTNPRAALGVGLDGSPHLLLYGSGETVQGRLMVLASGAPALSLFDSDKGLRAVLRLGTGGSPRLVLADKHGKIIWKAP
ncbi:MAG: hypothetical protein ACE5JN_01900 [Candidatus Methylomirabilia bacterium]